MPAAMGFLVWLFAVAVFLVAAPVLAQESVDPATESSVAEASTEADALATVPDTPSDEAERLRLAVAWEQRLRAERVAPPLRSRWYGWQTLTADGVSLALFVSAFASPGSRANGVAASFSVHGYLFAAPAIHMLHKRVGIGFASAGLRAGLPSLGLTIGYLGSTCVSKEEEGDGILCGLGGALLGAGIGAVVAMGLDAALLAYDKVPYAQSAIMPTFSSGKNGTLVGVAGRF